MFFIKKNNKWIIAFTAQMEQTKENYISKVLVQKRKDRNSKETCTYIYLKESIKTLLNNMNCINE